MNYNKYDSNGNITKYNGTIFEYDSVIKDKLISVGGTAVNYANAASLNPTSWGKKSYTYEGRRLTRIRIDNTRLHGRVNIVVYNYEYDEQCHRIKKTSGNKITDYTYSGDKLVILTAFLMSNLKTKS